MPTILWSAIAFLCPVSVRRARIPPWMVGCSVLTRPSMISGKPVWSLTSITFSPASRNALAEPPVDRISTPCPASALPSSTRPSLSETEISARSIRAISGVGEGVYWGLADMAGLLDPRAGGLKAADLRVRPFQDPHLETLRRQGLDQL